MADQSDRRFEELTERHRECLRHVFQHRKSAEIAGILGISAKYVDNLLIEAKNIVGVSSRSEAAVLFAAYEAGVGSSHPVKNPSSLSPALRLPLPLPSRTAPDNILTWRQVAAWMWVIAIATPIGMMTTAMAVLALMIVFGRNPI